MADQLTTEQALAQFRSNGDVEEVRRKFPEVPLLQIREAIGKYVTGIMKSYREVPVEGKGIRVFVTLKLGLTNAKAIVKTNEKGADGKTVYKDAEVKEGEDITFVAPTRLARLLKDIVPGTELFIEYNGKLTAVEKGRSVTAHKFTVRAKKTEVPF